MDSVVFIDDQWQDADYSIGPRLVNVHPSYAQHQKIKPYSLNDIRDVRVQEALIMKDLLFVLVGLEGSYIRYSEKYDPHLPSGRARGPDYKINKHLDASLKDVTKRMVLVSKMFVLLTTFTENYNYLDSGRVVQALVSQVREFLKVYLMFLDQMEQQFRQSRSFSLRQFEQEMKSNVTYKMKHLYDIVSSIYELAAIRRKEDQSSAFNNFINNIRQDLQQTGSIDLLSDTTNLHQVKGGLVLNIVHEKILSNSGDIKSKEFLDVLFKNISRSYVSMLNDWITKGDLNDPHGEFFITTNLARDFKVNSLNSEQYWDSKYVIKKDGLPRQFADKDLQLKVLHTGKYLNVLKECGVTLDSFSDERIDDLNGSNLLLVLERAYAVANKFIMDLFLNGYHFKELVNDLEGYFLLQNASNIVEFMSLCAGDFKRPHDQVPVSRFKRSFETTFAGKKDLIYQLLNVTLEKESIYSYLLEILKVEAIDAEQALKSNNFDALKNLISQTLDIEKDTSRDPTSPELMRSINYFNLEIILPFPLNLVVSRTVIIQYQLMFRHLLVLHYTDKQLSETWLEINKNKIWKFRHFDKPIPKWIARARSLHDRMKDFVRIYFDFLVNDIIDKSWSDLMQSLYEAGDFEQLAQALQSFLNSVLKGSILTTEKLIKIFSRLFQIINAYCTFLLSLRKVLILLNYELFEKYNDRLKDQEYDYNKNLERLERLNLYLNEYLDGFGQHLSGFMEGLRYYGELETTEFLILVTRLENAFPDNE
ncbi:Spindle pole body component SPC97 [Cyberlindnera fabianii]|uniref:Spindle pole body component n=1 Tax=Cyberlindnera fabianii TaxID=36022 RepID=A0A1V2LCU2_CYBFA|nr:Spindle pole body component SPC97 [Cyberlindnera fabianii]